MKLLMVTVGTGRYAVAADAVEQILDPALEPGLKPDAGSGEVVWRGGRHKVVRLPEAAGRATPASPGLYLVLIKKVGGIALPVDSAEAIRDVPGTAIAPLPAFIFRAGRGLFRGIFFDGREPRLLVDVGAIA